MYIQRTINIFDMILDKFLNIKLVFDLIQFCMYFMFTFCYMVFIY